MSTNKVKMTDWKEFYIKEIFVTEKKGKKIQVPTGASVPQKELEEGDIPKISVSSYNNGIVGYYSSQSKNFRTFENFISVSFLSTVFYHPYKAFLDMKVHCLKPINQQLNKYTGSFLTSIINKSLNKYTYSDQISSTILPNLKIMLPINNDGKLDWIYMENFMKEIENKSINKIKKLTFNNNYTKKLNINSWKSYHLYDLFEIDSGSKLDKVAMKFNNPTINFVGRSGVNNGVTTRVDEIEGFLPYEAGNMTLALGGAYLGSCFVQNNRFYTSQNVIVLKPKIDMSLNVKQFISTIIFKEGNTHYKAFIDELNRHIKTDFSIMLPVNKNGDLDYNYMENFIEEIRNKTIFNINTLKKF